MSEDAILIVLAIFALGLIVLIIVYWPLAVIISVIIFLLYLLSKKWNGKVATFTIEAVGIVLIAGAIWVCSEGPEIYSDYRNYDRYDAYDARRPYISINDWDDIYHEYKKSRSPEGIIEEKQRSISHMKAKLNVQLKNISEVHKKYQEEIEQFVAEIKQEQQDHNIGSMQYATQRMQYNVRLLQDRDASLQKLLEIESDTKSGLEEAIFMGRQLEGAKHMTQIVVGGESIGDGVEKILDKYGRYTETFAINPSELTFKSPEVIWKTYIQ